MLVSFCVQQLQTGCKLFLNFSVNFSVNFKVGFQQIFHMEQRAPDASDRAPRGRANFGYADLGYNVMLLTPIQVRFQNELHRYPL